MVSHRLVKKNVSSNDGLELNFKSDIHREIDIV